MIWLLRKIQDNIKIHVKYFTDNYHIIQCRHCSGVEPTYMYGRYMYMYSILWALNSLYCWPSLCMYMYTFGHLPSWPFPYTVGLLPILLAFSLYCWPSPYTVGLLSVLLAFSLYCWPSPYTVGLLPILLAFSLYCWLLSILLAFSLYCWPSPYTVGLLPILLAFSLYCWPSPYTVGLLPILLAFSLYCWPSPYTVGLFSILLAFSLTCTCTCSFKTLQVVMHSNINIVLQTFFLVSTLHDCSMVHCNVLFTCTL